LDTGGIRSPPPLAPSPAYHTLPAENTPVTVRHGAQVPFFALRLLPYRLSLPLSHDPLFTSVSPAHPTIRQPFLLCETLIGRVHGRASGDKSVVNYLTKLARLPPAPVSGNKRRHGWASISSPPLRAGAGCEPFSLPSGMWTPRFSSLFPCALLLYFLVETLVASRCRFYHGFRPSLPSFRSPLLIPHSEPRNAHTPFFTNMANGRESIHDPEFSLLYHSSGRGPLCAAGGASLLKKKGAPREPLETLALLPSQTRLLLPSLVRAILHTFANSARG